MNPEQPDIPRILLVGNNERDHAVISRVLASAETSGFSRDGLDKLVGSSFAGYDLVSCFDLETAFEEIAGAVLSNRSFALVLVDLNFVSAAQALASAGKIIQLDPLANILLMNAALDFDSVDSSVRLRLAERLFYAEKPVSPRELKLFALLLSIKQRPEGRLSGDNLEPVTVATDLAASVSARTTELEALQHNLRNCEEMLARQAAELEESAIAMKVLLKTTAAEDPGLDEKVLARITREMDEKISLNAKELTDPFLDKLARTRLDDEQQKYLDILRNNLDRITSPVMRRLYSDDYGLTPSELQVANLVRQGQSTKSVAILLNLSTRTIEFHRDNIRKKLGLKDRRIGLRKALESL